MRQELELTSNGEAEHHQTQGLHPIGPIVSGEELWRLKSIEESVVSLAICERQIPTALRDWLSSLAPGNLPAGRLLVRRDQIELAVESLLEEVLEVTPVACMLAADIIHLAQLFVEIACCDEVDIRLDVIQHDACQKFHLDNVALRLVTTYIGDSTQFVLPEYASEALEAQQDYLGPLEQMPGEAVAIFKGAQAAVGNGIVHRSPPIKAKKQTRLFLCLNERSHASPSLWKPGGAAMIGAKSLS